MAYGLTPRQRREGIRSMIDLIENHEPLPMTTFEMIRLRDESGVSLKTCDNSENIVLEGIVYTGGAVGVRWRTDYWSLVFYPDWKSFVNIHIGSHPTNGTILRFYPKEGETWEWKQGQQREPCDCAE